MDDFIQNMKTDVTGMADKAPQLVYALFTLLVFVVIGTLIAVAIQKGMNRGNFSKTYQAFFLKIIRWIFYLFGFLMALNILGFKSIATSLLAGGGITAVVLGFAFREIGENILAGFFLAFNRPFNIGDLIQSENLQGRVEGVELRHTHIRTAEGCDIFIPSSQIFNSPLLNYTRDGLRRSGFTVGIDYNDNIKQALELLHKEVSAFDEILVSPAPGVSISGFMPNYVEVQIYFWINTFNQEDSLSRIRTETMEACRKKLIEQNFTFSSSVTTALEMDQLKVILEK